MVCGRLRYRRKDRGIDAVEVVRDIAVPEAEDRPAVRREVGCAGFVAFELFTVVAAVQLDADRELSARDVDDVMTDQQLAGEAGPVLSKDAP